MKKICIPLLITQLSIPSLAIAAQPTPTTPSIPPAAMGNAPFGFKWGQSIAEVRNRQPSANSPDSDGTVCLKKTGTIITKCVNVMAPKPLLTEGDYTLLFDKNGFLFQVSFEHYTTISSGNKGGVKRSLYSTPDTVDPSFLAIASQHLKNYAEYVNILEKKYGKPTTSDIGNNFATYTWLKNKTPYIKLEIETSPKTAIKITYSSSEAEKNLRDNDEYHSLYEASVL
ncbi:TPA: hypothetical protein ACSCYS_003426 [Aeromonas veronii]